MNATYIDRLENDSITYDEALNSLREDRKNRTDINVQLSRCEIGYDDKGIIVETPNGKVLTPTIHALKQMGFNLDGTPQGVINFLTDPSFKKGVAKPDRQDKHIVHKRGEKDFKVLADVLKLGQEYAKAENPDKVFRLRTDETNAMRACVTELYQPIDNIWLIETLQELLPNGKIHGWSSDGDSIYGSIYLPDSRVSKSDSDYGGLFNFGNCEIGKRRYTTGGGIIREICTNGMIGISEFFSIANKVHRGKGEINLTSLTSTLVNGINRVSSQFDTIIDKYVALESKTVNVSMSRVFAAIAEDFRMTTKNQKSQLTKAFEHWQQFEPGDSSLRGIIAGITRASQDFDPKTRDELDNIGGQLISLSDRKWDNILVKAGNYSESKVLDLYGISV
jgi:hypothetical protein